MDILYEALMNYISDIKERIEYYENTYDFDEKTTITKLCELDIIYNKIDNFIDKISINIDNNIMDLTVKQRNIYFKEFELSTDDINNIKKYNRTIKNRLNKRNFRVKINSTYKKN